MSGEGNTDNKALVVIRRDWRNDAIFLILSLGAIAFFVWMLTEMSEESLYEARVRRGGVLKFLVGMLGFEWFLAGMAIGTAAVAVVAFGFWRRLVDRRPDICMDDQGFHFHPTRYRPIHLRWDEIKEWQVERDPHFRLVRVYGEKRHWSFMSIYPRKSIDIQADHVHVRKVVAALQLMRVPFSGPL